MHKIIAHIVASIASLLLPLLFFALAYWDVHRPKVGPVGDGQLHISFYQALPGILLFLSGCLNLPLALYHYKKHRDEMRGE
ncbi:MAG: hypothetical protein J7639_12780 [Paenibacillaceae bacterium]|nr:hypothetical protein [Paenibacillaceae bacterium]